MTQPAGQSEVTDAVANDAVGAMDLVILHWNGMGFEIRIGFVWLLIAATVGILIFALSRSTIRRRLRKFRVRSVKLKFGGAEAEVCPDHDTRRVAHQAWVEIKSRKVGLPFDADHDVIVEVYDSWYQLFSVLRELAKSIPPDRLHDCDDTREVVNLLLKSLNDGLRPHLTQWQARFRRWYEVEAQKSECADLTPQEIQRRFPEYDALVADISAVSAKFVEFADSLARVVKEQL